MDYVVRRSYSGELTHYGISGMHWGERRFQNSDGTLTPEGKIRYKRAEGDALNYKSIGQRVRRTIGGGFLGGLAGVGTAVGITAPWTAAGSAAIASLGASFVTGTLALAGAGAIGGLAVTALVQGAHAVKVRKGMNFVNKYDEAYNKTYGG